MRWCRISSINSIILYIEPILSLQSYPASVPPSLPTFQQSLHTFPRIQRIICESSQIHNVFFSDSGLSREATLQGNKFSFKTHPTNASEAEGKFSKTLQLRKWLLLWGHFLLGSSRAVCQVGSVAMPVWVDRRVAGAQRGGFGVCFRRHSGITSANGD